jgi:hypothetical protein
VRIFGAALVILGLLGLTFGGIPYDKKETVARIGDFRMEATEKRHLTLPPVVFGFAILVGATLWFKGGSRPG